MTEYTFVEDDGEVVTEVEKVAQWQIEDEVTFLEEEAEKEFASINDDKQVKTLRCETCGKNFSRWSDFARHYMAKHVEPTEDKDKDLIRAAGGIA